MRNKVHYNQYCLFNSFTFFFFKENSQEYKQYFIVITYKDLNVRSCPYAALEFGFRKIHFYQ